MTKYTLITGASSGIGREFAFQYAQKGHALIITARSEDKLNEIANEIRQNYKVPVEVIVQDLSKPNSAEELFKKCFDLKVSVNYLINDAGIGLIGEFESHEISQIQEMLLLNILALTKLTYLFLPQLKTNRGVLLNVASQVAFNPAPYMAAYAGTKAYVLHFTEALRVELEESGVQVMALCPGPTYTNFFERAHSTPENINFKFRSPEEVVSIAIEGIENKNPVTVTGWENKTWAFFTRFIPRSLLSKMAAGTVKNPKTK